MADFEQAGATERLRRVAILREMLAKLKRSQAEALGVAPSATPAEVRSAFMALTKQYHPAKFARLDEATVKLANEVFLQLREAYESLSTAGNRRARTLPGMAGDAEPTRKPEGAMPLAGAAAGQGVRVPDRAGPLAGHAAGAPAVRISDRAGDRAAAAPSVPAANTNSTALPTANGPPARPVTRPLIGGNRPGASATPGAAPPTRPSAPSISTTAPSPAAAPAARPGGAAIGAPPTRPSAPSISAPISTSASPPVSAASPHAAGARPSTVPAAGSGKIAAPAASSSSSSSSSSSVGGPKLRFGAGAPPPVAPPVAPSAIGQSQPGASANPHNNAEHARIRGLISRQKWTEARDALQLLLLRAPTDRGSMANLAYVRAREALELGNVSEARRELLRALAIEPTMEPARTTLREINDVTPSSAPRR